MILLQFQIIMNTSDSVFYSRGPMWPIYYNYDPYRPPSVYLNEISDWKGNHYLKESCYLSKWTLNSTSINSILQSFEDFTYSHLLFSKVQFLHDNCYSNGRPITLE